MQTLLHLPYHWLHPQDLATLARIQSRYPFVNQMKVGHTSDKVAGRLPAKPLVQAQLSAQRAYI